MVESNLDGGISHSLIASHVRSRAVLEGERNAQESCMEAKGGIGVDVVTELAAAQSRWEALEAEGSATPSNPSPGFQH